MFDYSAAVRERVFIDQPGIDQDGNGVADRIAIEIIRPANPDAGLDPGDHRAEPVLHDGLPRQRGRVHRRHDADGLNDKWPLFYDNYFVPRGYAVDPRGDERHLELDRLPDARRRRATSPA